MIKINKKFYYPSSTRKIIDGKRQDKSPDALPEMLTEALQVGFDTNVGHDFIEDADKRFDFYNRVEGKVPFDLEMFNKITDGGLSNKTLNSPQLAEYMGYDTLNLYFKEEFLKDGRFINSEIEKLFKNHYKRRVFQNTELDEDGYPTGYDQHPEEYWYRDFAITTRINSEFTNILKGIHPDKF